MDWETQNLRRSLRSYASKVGAFKTREEFFDEFEVHDAELIIGIDGKFRDAELLLSGGGETVILRVSNLKITASYLDKTVSSSVDNQQLADELHEYYERIYHGLKDNGTL